MPVYGHRLMSFRCLVTGEYAELKRQDGLSDEPESVHFAFKIKREALEITRFKLNKVCLIRSQH
ncbi:Uncharacterised protein [Escherichia coli]|uniref:Uncharacterized protein n=1 Tax=Escherichia coli TaxID=562 RepID=A0A377B5C9_ECOLX|nr:Uncharacterised protein [Escherichia coli]